MYSKEELNSLKTTAKRFGLDKLEIGYGLCISDGEVKDTELVIEEDMEDG